MWTLMNDVHADDDDDDDDDDDSYENGHNDDDDRDDGDLSERESLSVCPLLWGMGERPPINKAWYRPRAS